MLRQSLLGIAVSIRNIAIHAMMMVALIQVARIASESATSRQSLRLTAVMSATASVLMASHLVEVLVWSFACSLIGYFLALILFILPLQTTQRLATAT